MGGGGSRGRAQKPRQPVYDKQDLSSSQTFSVLMLLGEGPISGIVGDDRASQWEEGVFLDGTRLMRNGRFQFNSVQAEIIEGEQEQRSLDSVGRAENVVPVNKTAKGPEDFSGDVDDVIEDVDNLATNARNVYDDILSNRQGSSENRGFLRNALDRAQGFRSEFDSSDDDQKSGIISSMLGWLRTAVTLIRQIKPGEHDDLEQEITRLRNQDAHKVVDGEDVIIDVINENVTKVRISLLWQRMEKRNIENGDRLRTEVEFSFGFAYGRTRDFRWRNATVSGRSTTPFSRSYVFTLSQAPPVSIAVRRITPEDKPEDEHDRSFDVRFITEIIDQELAYPNSALLKISGKAEEFSSIPNVSCRTRGMRVRIPSNASVREDGSLAYNGPFTGDLGGREWCSDPVWVLYDILSSTRYGLGRHLGNQAVNLASFYEASKYSSEQITDQEGVTTPRFSANYYFDRSTTAYNMINLLANSMRAMPYYSADSIVLAQDSPQDPKFILTRSNVTAAGFSYESSSQRLRPNVVIVPWYDMETRQGRLEQVEDEPDILEKGAQIERLPDIGLISRAQARRWGRWFLYTEQHEGLAVSCTLVPPEGIYIRPGDIVRISDPLLAGVRVGGQITGWELRDAYIVLWTDSKATEELIPAEFVAIECVGDRILDLEPVLQQIEDGVWVMYVDADEFYDEGELLPPLTNGQWLAWTTKLNPALYRVINVSEREENNGCVYPMMAIAHNPSKFDFIEKAAPLDIPRVSLYSEPPDIPSGLVAVEAFYLSNSFLKNKIILSWDAVPLVSRYVVSWESDGNWQDAEVRQTEFELLDTTEGRYRFRVWAVNLFEAYSETYAEIAFVALGQNRQPKKPQGLQISLYSQGQLLLKWTPPTEPNVIHGGKTLIRRSLSDDLAQWNTAEALATVDGNVSQAILEARDGTYLLRFESATGVQSEIASIDVEGVFNELVADMSYAIGPEHWSDGWVRTLPRVREPIDQAIIARVIEDDTDGVSIDNDGNIRCSNNDTDKVLMLALDGLPSAYPAGLQIFATQPGPKTIDEVTDLIDDWLDVDLLLQSSGRRSLVGTIQDTELRIPTGSDILPAMDVIAEEIQFANIPEITINTEKVELTDANERFKSTYNITFDQEPTQPFTIRPVQVEGLAISPRAILVTAGNYRSSHQFTVMRIFSRSDTGALTNTIYHTIQTPSIGNYAAAEVPPLPVEADPGVAPQYDISYAPVVTGSEVRMTIRVERTTPYVANHTIEFSDAISGGTSVPYGGVRWGPDGIVSRTIRFPYGNGYIELLNNDVGDSGVRVGVIFVERVRATTTPTVTPYPRDLDSGIRARLILNGSFWQNKIIQQLSVNFSVRLIQAERVVRFGSNEFVTEKEQSLETEGFWSYPSVFADYRPPSRSVSVEYLDVSRSRVRVILSRPRVLDCYFKISGYG